MSATPPADPASRFRRGKRRARRVALALLAATIALGVVWVASPASDWYLPGQTVTLSTAEENHVNGHLVVVGVADDGSAASIAVNTLSNDRSVVPGDTVSLGLCQRLRVVSIERAAPEPDGEIAVGGVATVVVRVTLW